MYIFICENEEVGHEIVQKYFDKDKITYANMLPEEKRGKITEAIQAIEEENL